MFRSPPLRLRAIRALFVVGCIGQVLSAPCHGAPAVTEAPVQGERPKYDPLTEPRFMVGTLDLTVRDEERKRDVPLKVYVPSTKTEAPVVLFSHGLGGSRENNSFLGRHWAARGYVSVFLQHEGSDNTVWQGKTPRQLAGAMQQAANAQNFQRRVQDVGIVLDQLERWNQDEKHPLWHHLNMKRVGMSGHSFGAVTTQAVSGQAFPIFGTQGTDARIKAACLFSPSSPRQGKGAAGRGRVTAEQAFGTVKTPWLLMTGTKDLSPIGGADLASRLAVYPALPAGNKYEVVLEGAEHSAFGDRLLPGDKNTRNPNHHRAMLALTTAFWDAYLRDDKAARAWLDGEAVKGVLEKGDRWQKK